MIVQLSPGTIYNISTSTGFTNMVETANTHTSFTLPLHISSPHDALEGIPRTVLSVFLATATTSKPNQSPPHARKLRMHVIPRFKAAIVERQTSVTESNSMEWLESGLLAISMPLRARAICDCRRTESWCETSSEARR